MLLWDYMKRQCSGYGHLFGEDYIERISAELQHLSTLIGLGLHIYRLSTIVALVTCLGLSLHAQGQERRC